MYVINTWFQFEDKSQNISKVIVFTRNHTDDKADDDAEDDGTKNNTSPPGREEIQCKTCISVFPWSRVVGQLLNMELTGSVIVKNLILF